MVKFEKMGAPFGWGLGWRGVGWGVGGGEGGLGWVGVVVVGGRWSRYAVMINIVTASRRPSVPISAPTELFIHTAD